MAKSKQEYILTNLDGSTRSLYFSGRDSWCLNALIDAGNSGITAIDNPAPRLSGYVWNLRQAGLDIITHHEAHGGAFSGVHGRYELNSKIKLVAESEAA